MPNIFSRSMKTSRKGIVWGVCDISCKKKANNFFFQKKRRGNFNRKGFPGFELCHNNFRRIFLKFAFWLLTFLGYSEQNANLGEKELISLTSLHHHCHSNKFPMFYDFFLHSCRPCNLTIDCSKKTNSEFIEVSICFINTDARYF